MSMVNKLYEKRVLIVRILIAILLSAILAYDLLLSYLVFPITEGWWEVYAWLNNTTGDLYKNYSAMFPPLYILLIAKLDALFNGSLLSVRLSMVVVRWLILGALFVWLNRFVNKPFAIFASIIAISLVMANPVYFPKDYHTLVELLIIGCLVILVVKQNED